MRRTLPILALLLGVVFATVPALADTMTYNSPVSGTIVTLGGQGFYTGIYDATYNNGSNVDVHVICDDFYTDIYPGSNWKLSTDGSRLFPEYTAGNDPNSIINSLMASGSISLITQDQNYNMIEYLAKQVFVPSSPLSSQEVNDLSVAIWSLNYNFGSLLTNYGDYSAVESLVTDAFNNRTYSISGFTVYTPNAGPTGQEFVSYSPIPTPEPPCILLIGLSLLGFLMFRRRKTAKQIG